MPHTPPDEIYYRIDSDGRIVDVGGGWETAALDNGGSALVAENVIGSNLYDHISGHFTRVFLKRFIADARMRGTQTRLVYRCDSPTQKQLMEMRVDPEDDDCVRLTHRFVEAAPLPFAIPVTVAPTLKAARALRCSMCNRLQFKANTEWREPEDAILSGDDVLVIHSVCPDCRKGIIVKRLSPLAAP